MILSDIIFLGYIFADINGLTFSYEEPCMLRIGIIAALRNSLMELNRELLKVGDWF